MSAGLKAKNAEPLKNLVRRVVEPMEGVGAEAKRHLFGILDTLPMAYAKANAIFSTPERKAPGSGGVFGIFVNDMCKGCGECVEVCGEHQALKMVEETEELNARHTTAIGFLDLLPDTPHPGGSFRTLVAG